ncbi:DUF998 domain-containing protein [Streptosporangium sp. KLBMP 9127]|nr:DUF998 domain-containing protein [Streptosporangium sp. KLBMP 9127]
MTRSSHSSPVAPGPGGGLRLTKVTKRLLRCGVVAGPLFVVAFLVEGATRDGYSALRHPVSSLALGDFGWTQIVNFIVAGLLTVAFAVGARRALRSAPGPAKGSTGGPLLIGLWGAGLLGAGIFVTEPVSGYPQGTPDRMTYTSLHGVLHDAFSVPAFFGLAAACVVFTVRFAVRRERGWALYSAVTVVVFLTAFFLSGRAFEQTEGLVELGGLYQRISVCAGYAWLTALAVRLLGTRPDSSATTADRGVTDAPHDPARAAR